MNENNKENRHVVDAEVIDTPTSGSRDQYGRYSRYYGDNVHVSYFSMVGPSAPGHQGLPLATIITLALFFGCLFQWGFLAALGFAFFYVIGSGIAIYNNVRTVLQGRVPNPWLCRIAVWGISLLLVSWLVK